MRMLTLWLPMAVCCSFLFVVGPASAADLVSTARHYVGGNPTGKHSLWCGNFMNFVLKQSGYKPSASNESLSFAHYGRRIPGPQVGAIAVMHRKGGGHVGVVSAIDPNGNPVIISGNHRRNKRGVRVVGESVYPKGRISAYVLPGG